MQETLLMSIKTVHARKIFNGIKNYEYRKKSIGEKNLNKYCFIYSSEEEKAVIGYVKFDYIVSGNPEYLIKNTTPENIPGLKNYFKDRTVCYALHIKAYKLLEKPIKLQEIRNNEPKFVIPQYYRYIKENEYIYKILKKYIKHT